LGCQTFLEIFGITLTNYLPIIVALVAAVTYMNIAEHLLRYFNQGSRRLTSFDNQELKERFEGFKMRLNEIKHDIHMYYLFLQNKESIVDSVINPRQMSYN